MQNIVIDTNVYISALVFGGAPRTVLEKVIRDPEYALIISEEIYTEMRRVVVTKFPDFVNEYMQLETLLRTEAHCIKLGSIIITACRDQYDNHLLETAVLSGATTIITGDSDLLVLHPFAKVGIITASDFLK